MPSNSKVHLLTRGCGEGNFCVYTDSGEGDGTPLQYSCLENPMGGGAWWAAVHGVAKSQTRLKRLHLHFSLLCTGEGNGDPLQCSWLPNPRNWGAWWAAICGVIQSQTRLKRLSSSSSRGVRVLQGKEMPPGETKWRNT